MDIISFVQGALWSDREGRISDKSYEHEADAFLQRALRRALGKKGPSEMPNGVLREWSTLETGCFGRIFPTEEELRVRRLQWY